ncbi:hypothetical protein G7067_10945 [Leucobacter insecticola]|uniref:Uncharacterized protein n=1 Tax=Leucobacter insecticola TaxID=2714934 RepID=A0A6G8FKI5_9MICO|nr:hypothetical protein [Leucobacter insecticola]QIM16799.1 hypothetical protein G7067_10945 [Leucobacter insecticola]
MPGKRMARRRSSLARQRIPIITGLAAFLIAMSSGGAFAFWSAQATGEGEISTEVVTIEEEGFSDMSAVYTTGKNAATASFLVKNTGSIKGDAEIHITAAGPLAEGLKLVVWEIGPQDPCDAETHAPGTAARGTWAAPPSLTRQLEADEEASYCLHSYVMNWADVATPDGTQSFTAEMMVSLDAKGWHAETTPSTNTQETQGAFPPAPDFFDPKVSRWFQVKTPQNQYVCLAAYVNYTSLYGSSIHTYNCTRNATRRWEFIPVYGTDQSLVTIRPRHALLARLSENPGGRLTLIDSRFGLSLFQQWIVREDSSTVPSTFQFENAGSGACLNVQAVQGPTPLTTLPCDNASTRLYLERDQLELLFNPWTERYSIDFAGVAFYFNARLQVWDSGSWTDVSLAGQNDTTMSLPLSNIPMGENTYRVTDWAANLVLYDNIIINREGNTLTAVGGFG